MRWPVALRRPITTERVLSPRNWDSRVTLLLDGSARRLLEIIRSLAICSTSTIEGKWIVAGERSRINSRANCSGVGGLSRRSAKKLVKILNSRSGEVLRELADKAVEFVDEARMDIVADRTMIGAGDLIERGKVVSRDNPFH